MTARFTSHALRRLRERQIPLRIARAALYSPDKVEASRVNPERLLFKKVYMHPTLRRDHLLMLVCEKNGAALEVITVIDTSKISKYL